MALIKVKLDKKLTPESIRDMLYFFVNAAKNMHLETKSFAEHKAFGEFYDKLADFQDDCLEKLMGYMGGKRLGAPKIAEIPEYTEKSAVQLVDEVGEFAYSLYEWAEEKKFCDIENMAQSLSGDAAKTAYLLTLK